MAPLFMTKCQYSDVISAAFAVKTVSESVNEQCIVIFIHYSKNCSQKVEKICMLSIMGLLFNEWCYLKVDEMF